MSAKRPPRTKLQPVTELDRILQLIAQGPLGPTWIVSHGPKDTARALIEQCGGSVQAAHERVTKAAKQLKRSRGHPEARSDWLLVLVAECIQRETRCSDTAALRKAAAWAIGDHAKLDSLTRRLRTKLKGKTLKEFAGGQAIELVRRALGEFSLRLRASGKN